MGEAVAAKRRLWRPPRSSTRGGAIWGRHCRQHCTRSGADPAFQLRFVSINAIEQGSPLNSLAPRSRWRPSSKKISRVRHDSRHRPGLRQEAGARLRSSRVRRNRAGAAAPAGGNRDRPEAGAADNRRLGRAEGDPRDHAVPAQQQRRHVSGGAYLQEVRERRRGNSEPPSPASPSGSAQRGTLWPLLPGTRIRIPGRRRRRWSPPFMRVCNRSGGSNTPSSKEPKVRRLSGGGEWIRTISSARADTDVRMWISASKRPSLLTSSAIGR